MSFRITVGWIVTICWIFIWSRFLFLDFEKASKMLFNEWGDFFAGISAPLAFLWLVIGYFQQGEELGQNTKALEQQEKALQLQVDELRQSVEQQNKSAIALNKQTEISSLVAFLEATNHILVSLERQKNRISNSDSSNKERSIKSITDKQEKYEYSIETILDEIKNLKRKSYE